MYFDGGDKKNGPTRLEPGGDGKNGDDKNEKKERKELDPFGILLNELQKKED